MWRVFADHAELMGFESSGSGTLTIPSTFRDLPVTAIRNDRSGYYSSYFSRIVIPASVEIVENGFFSNYYNLRELEVESGSKSFKSVDGVLFDAEGERLIAYPLNKEDTEYTVPDKTETIGEKAFYFNSSITKVTLPKSVRTIGSSAFAGCIVRQQGNARKGAAQGGQNGPRAVGTGTRLEVMFGLDAYL